MYYIEGNLCQLFPDRAVVSCGGMGYMLLISAKTYDKLVNQGAYTPAGEMSNMQVRLYTHVRLRDESLFEVFGFISEAELSMFKLLQTVSGVGTRAALSILSALDVDSICNAIATENTRLIATAQGVGQKAAQKICIDLKSKLETFMLENAVLTAEDRMSGAQVSVSAAEFDENKKIAAEALVNLGYTKQQAQKAVAKAQGNTPEDLIRNALSLL